LNSPHHGPIPVAVVGAGAFGRNHARVYHELAAADPGLTLAGVVDTDLERAQAVASQFGAPAFASVGELLAKTRVDAASVAVPTVHHLSVARELMQAGVDVLIEKPLAPSLEQADEIMALARAHNRVAQVGHLERFNPAVRATLPLVSQPMFFEVHRLSVFSPRALDVDVVLDLMIHDLDIVLSFVSAPVKEVRAVGLPILSPKVDIANVRLEFENGCVANFTASRVSTERIRKLRFFQPRQYISLDYTRQDVLVISVKPPSATVPDPAPEGSPLPPGFGLGGGLPQFAIAKPPVEQEEPLHAELRAFLDAVRRISPPLVTLEDGRRALALALDILESISGHARRAGLLPE
jgi:predicted dehydrogenase